MAEVKSSSDKNWDADYVDFMIGDGPHCLRCTHYQGDNKCAAFPNGIPEGIDHGKNHTTPFEGDNGIQFEEHPDGIRRNYS